MTWLQSRCFAGQIVQRVESRDTKPKSRSHKLSLCHFHNRTSCQRLACCALREVPGRNSNQMLSRQILLHPFGQFNPRSTTRLKVGVDIGRRYLSPAMMLRQPKHSTEVLTMQRFDTLEQQASSWRHVSVRPPRFEAGNSDSATRKSGMPQGWSG